MTPLPITVGNSFTLETGERIRCETFQNIPPKKPNPRFNCEIKRKNTTLGTDIATSLDVKNPIQPRSLFMVSENVLQHPTILERSEIVSRTDFKPKIPVSCSVKRGEGESPPTVRCDPLQT